MAHYEIDVVKSAKYYPEYRDKTAMVVATIETALPILARQFNVDMRLIKIVVRPIPGNTNGKCTYRAVHRFCVIEIDCRLATTGQVMNTLAHELTHVEQYQSGRLKFEIVYYNKAGRSRRRWDHIWVDPTTQEQTRVDLAAVKTYQEYRALPWEVEAFSRGEEFASANSHLSVVVARHMNTMKYAA